MGQRVSRNAKPVDARENEIVRAAIQPRYAVTLRNDKIACLMINE